MTTTNPVTDELRQRLLGQTQPIITLYLPCPYYDKADIELVIDDVERRLKSISVEPLSPLEKLGMSLVLGSAGMTRLNGDPW